MRDSSVSVVIPTVNRPDLLIRALDSVSRQTLRPLEIIVVVDGAHEEVAQLLRQRDRSTRIIELATTCGAAAARNCGAQHASGTWLAFLDDDDEWLPAKLERQVGAALQSPLLYPVVLSQVIVDTPRGRFLMPRRSPRRHERADHYLYCRKSLRSGEVFFHTSNTLVPRILFDAVKFRPGQRKWDDVDWLLRASQVAGVGLEFVPEPLSIWNAEDSSRKTITGKQDWKYLFDWARSNRELFSPHAYAGVLLISIMHEAVQQGDRSAIRALMQEAIRTGKPDAIQGALFLVGALALTVAPRSAYYWLKLRLRKRVSASVLRSCHLANQR